MSQDVTIALFVPKRTPYGTIMIGACQNAVFRWLASTTVTWQRYSPALSFPSEKLKLSGIVFSRLAVAATAPSGAVSKALADPW